MNRVSLIIPAYNEAKTVGKIIEVAKTVKDIYEIIVIDDGSTDDTADVAKLAGARVFSLKKNRGKGYAVKTGIKKSHGGILLFLDADIRNITTETIEKIISPVIKDEADFAKTTFSRRSGRVTEFVAKPLMKIFCPSYNFSQPLSGQFCVKKKFMESIDIPNNWGIDISTLLDAIRANQRIVEVDIGEMEHESEKKSDEEKIEMSENVIETFVRKIILFDPDKIIKPVKGIVAFDLDRTLLTQSSIEVLARKMKFSRQLKSIRKKYYAGKINESEITRYLARFFEGKTDDDIIEYIKDIELAKNAARTVRKLKDMGYKTILLSSAFSPITKHFKKKIGLDLWVSPVLLRKNGSYGGRVEFSKISNKNCCNQSICKGSVLRKVMDKYNITKEDVISVGDGINDICMFKESGRYLIIGDKLKDLPGAIRINDLSEILLYTK
ncbi:MAG: HAD-IB family phosphatase [Candidatus Aenigmatarchaeota archaeon]